MTTIMKPLKILLLASVAMGAVYVAVRWAPDPALAHEASSSRASLLVATTESPPPALLFDSGQAAAEREATVGLPGRSRAIPETKGDPFAILSWLPPVAPVRALPVPPPPKPAAPVAPPLPFTFVGMLERGTAPPQAFLAKGEALLVVAAGDTLDNNTYRVESLSPQQIVITYLPMTTRQTLNVSGATP